MVQKFESKRIHKRYFAPPYKLYKWIIDEYDQLKPKAAVISMHVKTFIRIFSRNCANLNAEIDKELIRKMFEYEVNPKAEKERLEALEKIGKSGGQRKDSISNMRGIERARFNCKPPAASTVPRAACFTRKRWSASVTADEQKIAECIQ